MRFEGLRETLLRGGVAPRHVRRYLAELSEHLDDLTAEQRAAGFDPEDAAIRARARLGSDQELAAAMLVHKNFRSWPAGAPWAFFGLLPPVAALAATMIPVGCLVLISKHFGFMGEHGVHAPEWFQLLATATVTGANLFPVPLAAALFVHVARRQRIRMVWPLTATAVLLLLFLHSEARFATAGHYHRALSVGFAPIFLPSALRTIVAQWPVVLTQYVLTLLPAVLLYRARKRST